MECVAKIIMECSVVAQLTLRGSTVKMSALVSQELSAHSLHVYVVDYIINLFPLKTTLELNETKSGILHYENTGVF